ncbi:coiled-coil domain-containing protein 106 [Syngnathus scovelli]|uniref:coiled-coil domain-containing protein 106 n=1 Tax=Syngnathus scovelli TaxID=161590 RepID=UPI002110D34B|nr:coiled-coil domain-containing protein 106 [Syngnathus scovelli]
MENGNRSDAASMSKNHSGSLHLQILKNEDSYEVAMPLEESNFEQQGGFFNQSDQHFEESAPSAGPSNVNNSFMVITNLRTQLQISVEKNSWLQKRIEDLEEERDFLRCQLDCFISSTKSQRQDQGYESRRFTWKGRREDEHPAEQQKRDSAHLPSRQFIQRRPAAAPPTASCKKHISNPISNQMASMNARFSSTQSAALLQGLAAGGASASGSGANRAVGLLMNDLSGHRNLGADSLPLLGESDEYLEHDDFLEEEEMISGEDAMQNPISSNKQQFKRRRIFRGLRERQRVKDPAGVLFRYKKILLTYQRLKNMSKAFQIHGVDRNTVASTTPIAELLLVAPEKVAVVGEFDPSKEKLLDYARRCYATLDDETQSRVQALKKNNLLLPISYRFRH